MRWYRFASRTARPNGWMPVRLPGRPPARLCRQQAAAAGILCSGCRGCAGRAPTPAGWTGRYRAVASAPAAPAPVYAAGLRLRLGLHRGLECAVACAVTGAGVQFGVRGLIRQPQRERKLRLRLRFWALADSARGAGRLRGSSNRQAHGPAKSAPQMRGVEAGSAACCPGLRHGPRTRASGSWVQLQPTSAARRLRRRCHGLRRGRLLRHDCHGRLRRRRVLLLGALAFLVSARGAVPGALRVAALAFLHGVLQLILKSGRAAGIRLRSGRTGLHRRLGRWWNGGRTNRYGGH